MNSILNLITVHPVAAIVTLSTLMMSVLFLLGFEVPQKIMLYITFRYRANRLHRLFPRSVIIWDELVFPIDQNFKLPKVGDYVMVKGNEFSGYSIMRDDHFEYITWEQVKALK